MARRRKRKKIKKVDPEGIVHIHSTFNNTIVTVTDKKGNTLTWASAGTIGYKGTKKSTPFAASLATEKAVKDAMNLGLKAAEVWIKGPGSGREAAIRSVQAAGLKVTAIKDVTPIPHNGCRPPKKRRV
ncbi:30S ribosomal protein S11 [candidate division WOR-3 bacterium]|nr:30S ribosomal protein S11 [candidate division WOR-3 bacterium]